MEPDIGTRVVCFTLKKLADKNQPMDYELVRACASEALGAQYEPTEFQLVLANLVDLRVVVKADSKVPLQLTPEGYDLADAHASSLLAEQRKAISTFVVRISRLQPAERAELCQEVLSGLPTEPFISVKRAVPADSSKYAVNAGCIEVTQRDATLYLATYVLTGRERLRFHAPIERVRNRFVKELAPQLPAWAVSWNEDDDSFTVLSSKPLPSESSFYQARLNARDSRTLDGIPSDLRRVVEEAVVEKFLEESMRPRGWRKLRFKADYICPSEESHATVDGLQWTLLPSMKTEVYAVHVPANAHGKSLYAVVADPSQRQVVTIADWVSSGHNPQRLKEGLRHVDEASAFHVLPDFDQCELSNPSQLERVNSPRDEVEVRLSYGGQLLSVNAGSLGLRKDLLESALPAPPSRPASALAPRVRLEQSRAWVSMLPTEVDLDGLSLRLVSAAAHLNDIASSTDGETTWRLSPPNLLFNKGRQRDDVTNDPRALFKYGPFNPPRHLAIAAVLAPDSLSQESLTDFVSTICEAYAKTNLGKMVAGATRFIRYPGKNVDGARNGLQSLPPPTADHEVILVVGPEDDDAYGRAKDLCASVGRRPSQYCYVSTARKIARGSFPTAKGLVLQTYLKTLQPGDALWTLSEQPSTRHTVFVGIGYSKRPATGDEATSHASLSMSDGVVLDWKPMGFMFRPQRYFTPNHARAFVGFLDIESANHPEVERFVVLRRGDVYPAEVEAIEAEYNRLAPKWSLDFVGVSDSRLRIFQDQDGVGNPESGLLQLLDDRRCLLSVSALPGQDVPGGSVRLMEITRAIGRTPVQDLGRELYDQAFLCWGSPGQPPRSPMPLDLAEKVAELTTTAQRDETLKHFAL